LKKLHLRPLLIWTFLSGFVALFLLRDAGGSGLLGFGAKIQVFPALLRWEITILLFAGMTLLAGRFYCSLLCPLGLFQEAVHGIGKHRMAGYRRGTSLRYWILAATVISMAAGTLGLLHLLDPFANFGRGITQILRPTIVAVNNLLASIPLPGDTSRFLHHLPSAPLDPPVAAAAGLFLVALTAWSVLRGRPYCDGLCPVGTFLGLFSSHSVLRVRFDENSCSNCGRCEAACPTACLSALERKIDHDRCVLCLSCVEACPGGALRLGILPAREGLQRRSFLRVAAGLGTALGLASVCRYLKPSAISESAEAAGPPISPPGSRSHEKFNRKCIACSACVKACPAGIIRPALLAWGASGLFQPILDYDFGYCQYECKSCTTVCPTGAIEPLSLRPSSGYRSPGPVPQGRLHRREEWYGLWGVCRALSHTSRPHGPLPGRPYDPESRPFRLHRLWCLPFRLPGHSESNGCQGPAHPRNRKGGCGPWRGTVDGPAGGIPLLGFKGKPKERSDRNEPWYGRDPRAFGACPAAVRGEKAARDRKIGGKRHPRIQEGVRIRRTGRKGEKGSGRQT